MTERSKNLMVLLIGGNPLPNYISTVYFMKHHNDETIIPIPSNIYLIHSRKTEAFSRAIKDLLIANKIVLHGQINMINIEKDQRDVGEINNKVSAALQEIVEQTDTINFVFTGGTKPMVVGTYQALKSSNRKLILSDMNPVNHKITCCVNNRIYSFPQTNDLRSLVSINIEELLSLHLCKIISSKSNVSSFYNIKHLQYLVNYANNPNMRYKRDYISKFEDIRNSWKKLGESIAKKKKKKKYRFKNKSTLIKTENSDFLKDYVSFLEDLKLVDLAEKLKMKLGEKYNPADQSSYSDSLAKFCFELVKYIRGGWLEEYVFTAVKEIVTQSQLKNTDLKCNIQAQPVDSTKDEGQMEIDVMLMKGYHMYLLSMTTSTTKGLVKSKAFEALYRANQLGGSHSTVIIVSMLNDENKNKLRKDLRAFSDISTHVFGSSELKNEWKGETPSLTSKIERIING